MIRSTAIRVAALAAASVLTVSSLAQAELLTGLTTNNSLVFFDSATPGTVTSPLAVLGLGSETLLDIDYRATNRLLYGLSDAGKVYSIDTATGAATLSATLAGASLTGGVRYGIDFNPTVDRMRIVGSNGQNLRITPGTSVTTVDGGLNGAATSAVSVGYTNAGLNPGGTTTLFYVSNETGALLSNTTNPNGGVLSAVGALGALTTNNVGFDISGMSGVAYASLTVVDTSSLYTLNLATGAATLVGPIGGGLELRGVSAPVPEPTSLSLLVLASAALIRRRK